MINSRRKLLCPAVWKFIILFFLKVKMYPLHFSGFVNRNKTVQWEQMFFWTADDQETDVRAVGFDLFLLFVDIRQIKE